jgi:superfamily II DNA or RNA helicase
MKATIILKDETNAKIEGLNITTRKRLQEKFSFMLPHAYHMAAYKLGRWDGKVKYFTIGGVTYCNLLPDIIPILLAEGYELDLDDRRPNPSFGEFSLVTETSLSNIKWPAGHPRAGEPVLLRDYQVNAINQFIQNPQCIQELSTASGKTIITATLSKLVEPYGRSIVIVPNIDLVKQTLADYQNLGLDVGVFYGAKKEVDKTHIICTWQSLESLERQRRAEKRTEGLFEFAKDVVCVIVDECHQSKSTVLQAMLTGPLAHVPIRWGLTGTVPKADNERMALRVSLGEVVNKVRAAELQDRGVLATCHVNIMQLEETVSYNNYQSELSYLTTDEQRLEWISKFVQGLAGSGNTLVLVDRIKSGKRLEELIPGSTFISGSVKSADRKTQYDEINEVDGKILIASFGIAAVGINVPRIFNLVLIEPGKSFVRVIQSIGRGIRKAKDKDHVEIYDIASTAKYSRKHLTERKKYYKEAEYPFTVNKVSYRKTGK